MRGTLARRRAKPASKRKNAPTRSVSRCRSKFRSWVFRRSWTGASAPKAICRRCTGTACDGKNPAGSCRLAFQIPEFYRSERMDSRPVVVTSNNAGGNILLPERLRPRMHLPVERTIDHLPDCRITGDLVTPARRPETVAVISGGTCGGIGRKLVAVFFTVEVPDGTVPEVVEARFSLCWRAVTSRRRYQNLRWPPPAGFRQRRTGGSWHHQSPDQGREGYSEHCVSAIECRFRNWTSDWKVPHTGTPLL